MRPCRRDRRLTTGSLKAIPTRSCLTCRQRGAKPSLTRLVAVGGSVTIDPSARLPGRGAYLCHREGCLDAALAKGGSRLLAALKLRGGRIEVDDEAIRAAWNEHHGDAASRAEGLEPGTATSAGVSE